MKNPVVFKFFVVVRLYEVVFMFFSAMLFSRIVETAQRRKNGGKSKLLCCTHNAFVTGGQYIGDPLTWVGHSQPVLKKLVSLDSVPVFSSLALWLAPGRPARRAI